MEIKKPKRRISPDREWISPQAARLSLYVSRVEMKAILDQGLLVVRQLPGCAPKVLRASVDNLAKTYTKTANSTAVA